MAEEKEKPTTQELESAFSSHLPPRQRKLFSDHCGPLKTFVRQTEDPSELNKSRLWGCPWSNTNLVVGKLEIQDGQEESDMCSWAWPVATCHFHKTAFATYCDHSVLRIIFL